MLAGRPELHPNCGAVPLVATIYNPWEDGIPSTYRQSDDEERKRTDDDGGRYPCPERQARCARGSTAQEWASHPPGEGAHRASLGYRGMHCRADLVPVQACTDDQVPPRALRWERLPRRAHSRRDTAPGSYSGRGRCL